MKKEYTQPIIEVIVLDTEDIVTASPVSFDPLGILDEDSDSWY